MFYSIIYVSGKFMESFRKFSSLPGTLEVDELVGLGIHVNQYGEIPTGVYWTANFNVVLPITGCPTDAARKMKIDGLVENPRRHQTKFGLS
jgi:hypothetical protein